jgi:hypothetical protein
LVSHANKADIIKKASGFPAPIFNAAPEFSLLSSALSDKGLPYSLDF